MIFFFFMNRTKVNRLFYEFPIIKCARNNMCRHDINFKTLKPGFTRAFLGQARLQSVDSVEFNTSVFKSNTDQFCTIEFKRENLQLLINHIILIQASETLIKK